MTILDGNVAQQDLICKRLNSSQADAAVSGFTGNLGDELLIRYLRHSLSTDLYVLFVQSDFRQFSLTDLFPEA